MARDIRTNFVLDGEAKYKSALKSISLEMRLLDSELGKATAGLDKNADAMQFLSATSTSLQKKMDVQKQKIEAVAKELAETEKAYGENSDEAKRLAIALNKAESELGKMAKELTDNDRKMEELKRSTDDAGNEMKQFEKKIDSAGDKARDASCKFENFGSALKTGLVKGAQAAAVAVAAVGAAIGAVTVKSFNLAVEFETAFTSVKKTVEGTDEQMAELEKGIRDMAKEVPATAVEISAVAEAAGQLGIETDNILEFSRVMIDLGEATNITAAEGSALAAQFANVMQMDQSNFDRFGATIVDLGNNSATTEADILSMAQRLAGAGKQVGMSEADVLGFAAALSSVGIDAEAGGSALSKVMVEMQLAAQKGGKDLEDFASVAGVSAQEFAQMYKDDAAAAMTVFVEGLGTLEDRGQDALVVLDDMGITEVRMRDALLRASNAGDLFSDSLDTANTAWGKNNALSKEAEQRYATTASQMQILKNTVSDLGISFGQELLPTVRAVMSEISTALADGFQAEDISTIGDSISSVLVDILAGVGNALPEVAKVLTNLITSAVDIVSTILPELMPVLLDSAFVLLDSLLGAILENVDPIAEMVTQLVLGLADFIIDNLPMVIEAAIQLVLAVATGILEALPEMMPAIMSMLQTIVNVVLDNLPLIIQTGLALLVAVIQGLQDARPQLAEMVPEIVQTIVDVIIDNLPLIISAGVDIIGAVIEGVLAEKMTLLAALPEIVNGIIDKFAETDWAQIGVDILLGIGNGIANTVGSVVDKAVSAAQDIAGGIQDFFGIASPSKLMTEYGGFISEGLANGIDAKSGLAQDAIDGLLPPTLDAKVSAEMLSSSELGGTVKKTVEHTGVIRVEGANSEGQLVAVVDMIVNQLRRDAMMAGTS